jgi:type II secretion system protein N
MKKWFLYTAYGILVLALFLYLLFPAAEVREYIVRRAEALDSSVSVRLGDVGPHLPPGLKLSELAVRYKDRPVFASSRLNVVPRYLSLFSRQKAFRLAGTAYGGALEGRAAIGGGEKPVYSIDLDFRSVPIGETAALKSLVPHQVEGTGEGRIRYSAKQGEFGNGSANITIRDSSVRFDDPIFGFSDLSTGTVQAVVELSGRAAEVTKLSIKGREFTGNANGTLELRRPLAKSRLKLDGTLRLRPSMIKKLGRQVPPQLLSIGDFVDKGIPFRISGTIERPAFSLR